MKPVRFLIVAIVLLGMVATASAITEEGTQITNKAVGNYKDANSNNMDPVNSNVVSTLVSQVAGVSFDDNDEGLSTGLTAMSTHYYDIQLSNTGNGTDSYALALTAGTGHTGTYTTTLYHDVNGNGLYDDGTDTVVPAAPSNTTGNMIYAVTPTTYDLIVAVTDATTNGAPEGDVFVVTLVAVSAHDSGVSDSVVMTTTVQKANVTVTVTPSTTTPLPGSVITYAVCLSNTGDDVAYNTAFTLLFPTTSTIYSYKAGTTYMGGTAWGAGNGGVLIGDPIETTPDAGDYGETTAYTLTVDIDNIAAGGDICVYFQVTIGSEVGEGDDIVIDPDVVYDNAETGGTSYPSPTPGGSPTIDVAETFGVDIVATGTTTFSADPGDTLFFAFTVENLGNGVDNFDLSASSDADDFITWYFFVDNGSGILSDDEISAGAISATGDLSSTVGTYIAYGIITVGTGDADVDLTTFTATSQGDSGESDTANSSATCTAPEITLLKSSPQAYTVGVDDPVYVAPTGTITYTIIVTNSGSGEATNVVVSDVIPTYTTYVPNSMTLDDATELTDPAIDDASGDSDGVTFSGTEVIWSFDSMASAASHTLTFQVTID